MTTTAERIEACSKTIEYANIATLTHKNALNSDDSLTVNIYRCSEKPQSNIYGIPYAPISFYALKIGDKYCGFKFENLAQAINGIKTFYSREYRIAYNEVHIFDVCDATLRNVGMLSASDFRIYARDFMDKRGRGSLLYPLHMHTLLYSACVLNPDLKESKTIKALEKLISTNLEEVAK